MVLPGHHKVSGFTAAGHRVFDFGAAAAGGMLTSTAVLYRSGTWWRGTIGPVGEGHAACAVRHRHTDRPWRLARFPPPGAELQLVRQGRPPARRGVDAIELTDNGTVIWVNPRTYLPVRVTSTMPGGARIQTDFGWFTPTRARLAQLRVAVPPGFRQVPPP